MFIFYLTFGNFCFIWVFITFHAEKKTGIYHKNGDFLREKNKKYSTPSGEN